MADPHIYLIAGEASGDYLGANLMRALKKANPGIRFSGIGGTQMESEGLKSLFPMTELSVMGVAEILPNLKHLLKRIRETINDIKETKPDGVVTIDAPDFSFRVMKGVRKEMPTPPKLIHYVAPSVWAWRPGRAKKIAGFLDGLMCLFDFEPAYFEKEGLKAVAVGHPVVERGILNADPSIYRDEIGITSSELTLGVLMGSRKVEVKYMGPILAKAAKLVAERLADPPHLIVPTLPQIHDEVWKHLKGYPGAIHFTTRQDLKYHAFKAMNAAMAVSGTVGLELAVTETPHLISYKMSMPTWFILKRVIRVRYAHLVNIIMGREIVPEFIQDNAQPEKIAACILDLYSNQKIRQAQYDAFKEVRERIGGGKVTPSEKAAAFVLDMLKS